MRFDAAHAAGLGEIAALVQGHHRHTAVQVSAAAATAAAVARTWQINLKAWPNYLVEKTV